MPLMEIGKAAEYVDLLVRRPVLNYKNTTTSNWFGMTGQMMTMPFSSILLLW